MREKDEIEEPARQGMKLETPSYNQQYKRALLFKGYGLGNILFRSTFSLQ